MPAVEGNEIFSDVGGARDAGSEYKEAVGEFAGCSELAFAGAEGDRGGRPWLRVRSRLWLGGSLCLRGGMRLWLGGLASARWNVRGNLSEG